MKVLVQWTAATSSDWVAIDSADWAVLPSKPEPIGGEIIDNAPGWICQICVQGMSFTGDHYAVLHDTPTGGCTGYCWSDDPGDFQPEDYFGHVTTFLPLAPDPKFGGAYNTRQTRQFFGGVAKRKLYADIKIDALPFTQFPKPDPALIRHGIWTTAELDAALKAAQTETGWRKWIEGVPAKDITDGLVRYRPV